VLTRGDTSVGGQVIEHLPSKYKAQSSNSSISERKEERKEGRKKEGTWRRVLVKTDEEVGLMYFQDEECHELWATTRSHEQEARSRFLFHPLFLTFVLQNCERISFHDCKSRVHGTLLYQS
jgi:hypothetical protein